MNIKKIAYILFMLFIPLSIWGQLEEPIDQSLLMNKKWAFRIEGKDYYSAMEFFEDKMIDAIITIDGSVSIEKKYYLSNIKDFIFDSNKVGKSTNGKYIVIYHKINNIETITVLEILKVNEQLLTIKSIENGTVLEYKVE